VRKKYSQFFILGVPVIELHGHVMDGFGIDDHAVLEVQWVGETVDGEAVDSCACLLFRSKDEKLIEIIDYY
jgi:hypothetical protein